MGQFKERKPGLVDFESMFNKETDLAFSLDCFLLIVSNFFSKFNSMEKYGYFRENFHPFWVLSQKEGRGIPKTIR